ncbi:putative oxidoreductase protein (plasmid) [Sinorhizobium sp. CCBAU 05631]|nr:putative oxidoreductase protein [Sinorhizobium sp. CCBAU 05631]
MTQRVKLAVLGAGLIGKRHIQHVLAEPLAQLIAVVDPTPVGETIAKEAGVKWFTSFADMIAADRPDGIIVATPNQAHVQNGLEAVEAGVPALIEKPIADDIISGEKLIAAAEEKGVPLLTGHHRRHNPVTQKAKEIIESGKLGRVLVVNAMFWLFKPDEYFDISWRRERGAWPVFLNLIHDVDNLRYLFGDVAAVQARESNAVRGNAVEETAVILRIGQTRFNRLGGIVLGWGRIEPGTLDVFVDQPLRVRGNFVSKPHVGFELVAEDEAAHSPRP